MNHPTSQPAPHPTSEVSAQPHAVGQQRRQTLRLMALTAAQWCLAGPVVMRDAWALAPVADAQPLKLLRIGYQKSAVNLVVVKQTRALEKRYPDAKITWLEFPAGPQLLEALATGSLEFGLTGDSPPVFAQAAGKDLLYVGAEPPKPKSSAILVLKDSPVQTVADLKGRKVALQKGSSAHFLLVRAVEKAGLAWADIQPVYLAPADARAALKAATERLGAQAQLSPQGGQTLVTLQGVDAQALSTWLGEVRRAARMAPIAVQLQRQDERYTGTVLLAGGGDAP